MHTLFRTLIALCYLASATLAQAGYVINSFSVAAAGGTPASITFLQCSAIDTTDLTTYSFTSQNTGTASADRYTLIGILSEDSASVFTVSSSDVGGDAATTLVDYGGAGGNPSAAFSMVANSAGTSETISVTMSEPIQQMQLCLWQVNNIASATPVATASARATAGANNDVSINVSALGIAAGVCASADLNGSPWTWTGLTERDDIAGGAGTFDITAADFTNDAVADTPLSIVTDPTGAASNTSCATVSIL